MKYLFVISDDSRWNDIENTLKSNRLEKDRDYDSFTSIFTGTGLIEIRNYSTLFLHKTDIDADESGKFMQSIRNHHSNVVLFSGGIEGYSIENNVVRLGYDIFLKNLGSFLQAPDSIYNLIGGRIKFIEKMRDHFMDNTVEFYPFNKIKRIVLEERYFIELQGDPETAKLISEIRKFCEKPSYDAFAEIRNKFSEILNGG